MTDQEKKYLTYTAVALVVGTAAYLLFFNNTESGNGVDPTGYGGNLPGGAIGAFNPSKVAIELYDAMKDGGTDEDQVLSILTPVNEAQFQQVFKAFGKLKYNPILGNQYSINPFSELDRYDLKGWLKSELSLSQYALLKTKYPSIL